MELDVKTGDLEKWASKIEEKGAHFAAEILRKSKRGLETQRKQRMVKFAKIKRKKTGFKRFAIVKDPNRAAELIKQSHSDHFSDIFKD